MAPDSRSLGLSGQSAAALTKQRRPEPGSQLVDPDPATRTRRGWGWVLPLLVGAHLLLCVFTKELASPWTALDAGLLVLFAVHPVARKLAVAVFPLWMLLIAYFDLLPQALRFRGEIHVADLYAAELRWFGLDAASGRIIPSAYFEQAHWAWLDLLCAFVYMAEFPELIVIGLGIWWRRPQHLRRLFWTFLLTNLAGAATWVLYPAAPPWYALHQGLGPADLTTKSSGAGLLRADEILGMNLIRQFYDQSVNVFGAMPSVHVGVATVAACLATSLGWRWALPAAAWAALMGFAAVYTQHHYVLDVLAGAGYAIAAFVLVTALDSRCGSKADGRSLPAPTP